MQGSGPDTPDMATTGARSRLLRVVETIQRVLDLSLKVLCVLSGVAIALILIVGVFYRYVLGQALPATGALPTVLFPWFIMSGAILASLRKEHLRVDYFILKLPERVQHWTLVSNKILIVAAFAYLSFVSFELLPLVESRSLPVLGWPASRAFVSLPLGFAGLALHTATDIVVDLLRPCKQETE